MSTAKSKSKSSIAAKKGWRTRRLKYGPSAGRIAALKGWQTRFEQAGDLERAEIEQRRVEILFVRRDAARKAARTRFERTEAEKIRRSEAARKGWATRRLKALKKERQKQVRSRTRKEKKELDSRLGPKDARLKGFRYADQVHFDVHDYNQEAIVSLIEMLKAQGIHFMRFLRQVPVASPTESSIYTSATGVASSKYYTKRDLNRRAEIEQLVGGMLTPGIDYIKEIVIKAGDIDKFGTALRKRLGAMKPLSRDEYKKKETQQVGIQIIKGAPKKKRRKTRRSKK